MLNFTMLKNLRFVTIHSFKVYPITRKIKIFFLKKNVNPKKIGNIKYLIYTIFSSKIKTNILLKGPYMYTWHLPTNILKYNPYPFLSTFSLFFFLF